jgi:hypothetical protein
MKIDFSKIFRLSTALTLASAVMYTLCTFTFLLLPDASYRFYESWFHGVGITANSALGPFTMSIEGYLLGLISVSIFTFVGGAIFGLITQVLGANRRIPGFRA